MTFAVGLLHFCVWATIVLASAFALLVMRRGYTERRAPIFKARQTAATGNYLRRVGGFEARKTGSATDAECLAAVGHLLLLLRGAERDRLIRLAESDGLLRRALRQTRAWRAARRIDAIRVLQQFGGESALLRLGEVLRGDRHRIVRLNAAFALASFGRLPPPRATIDLLGMPGRAPTRLDVAILRAMAPAYPQALQKLLDDPMPHGRRAAVIDALGWSGDHTQLPTLARACRFDNAEIRCAALRAAAKLGHPGAAPWVIAALRDPVTAVRIQAVNACAALGLVQAVPQLLALAGDAELWVRLRAAEALHKLNPPPAPQRLRA